VRGVTLKPPKHEMFGIADSPLGRLDTVKDR